MILGKEIKNDTRKFQEHVLQELSNINDSFVKNETAHGELSTKIESVKSELSPKIESVRTEVESVRTEIHKNFSIHLRWSIGTAIGLAGLIFVIVKFVV